MTVDVVVAPGVEYPPKADLREDVCSPLPMVPPGTVNPATMSADKAILQAKEVLEAFNLALESKDAEALAGCFYPEQAYWRDNVALTSHLRTFTQPGKVASALLEMTARCGISGKIECTGKAHFAVVNPVMMFIECEIGFRTTAPALNCSGKALILPIKSVTDGNVLWRIWVLSTWVESLADYPENVSLLSSPARCLDADTIETDVIILGAGTSGLITAARLKALGIDSVMVDRNAHVGENWTNRYDCLRFHVPTSNCEFPFSTFPKKLQTPHLLTKYDVAEHMREYAVNFGLNVVSSASVLLTTYDTSKQQWTIKLSTPQGLKTILGRQFVQATGLGCQIPHIPVVDDEGLYRGLSIHNTQYHNAQLLKAQGVKSVAVVGSANTAFDVMKECHDIGLKTTMVARSLTSIFPFEYLMDAHAIGAYEVLPVDEADKMLIPIPTALAGQFASGLFAHLASQEPDRYLALSKAGFPVRDSRDPHFNLQHHLAERAGGHYVDVGGTKLIASGAVAVRGLVEPVAFTEAGVRLSDGSALEVDAVIWCTGYAGKDVRATAARLLGAGSGTDVESGGEVLGPEDIAARLDATWGVDAEGEIRGVWKRHLRMENYWVMGGNIDHQRWWSRALSQQIKLALTGALPPAYRG